MLQKRNTKKGVSVTFIVDYLPDAELIEVAGEWNDWELEPMKKYKNGKHKLLVRLEADREYQFRYRIDGERWENEWEADRYVPNNQGSENSVVVC